MTTSFVFGTSTRCSGTAGKGTSMNAAVSKLTLILAFLATLSFTALGGSEAGRSADAPAPLTCTLIDNDFDIDDLMAMPMVFGQQHVAAVIQTEGVTLPGMAAPAADALINGDKTDTGARRVPVIVGGKQASGRDISEYKDWLPFFRAMMNQANGLLPVPPQQRPSDPNFAKTIASLVEDCDSVSILILGPYTSFIRYFPIIQDKIERIVISARMPGDISGGKKRLSFNCEYDLAACITAMLLLEGRSPFFVDLPRFPDCRDTSGTLPPHCYAPDLAMVAGDDLSGGLVRDGLTGRLRKALLNDMNCDHLLKADGDKTLTCSSRSTWEPVGIAAAGGGGVLLWDQVAALFLLRPDDFADGGKHFEPVILNGSHPETVDHLRDLWTQLSNAAVEMR